MEGFVKHRPPGTPQSFWFSKCGEAPENVHFQQVPTDIAATSLVTPLWEQQIWMKDKKNGVKIIALLFPGTVTLQNLLGLSETQFLHFKMG